jgi:asparagine synthetase B (glutamine-hydrolysing)
MIIYLQEPTSARPADSLQSTIFPTHFANAAGRRTPPHGDRHAGPVRTYSIGFDIAGYDEAPYAAAVARHLHTAHTERTVISKRAET